MADKKMTPIVVYRGQTNIENLPKTYQNQPNQIMVIQ